MATCRQSTSCGDGGHVEPMRYKASLSSRPQESITASQHHFQTIILATSIASQFIMRSIIFALAATTAIAADVSVTWRHEKSSGSTSLTVHSAVDDAVLAETCGNSLGSLTFNVDETGAGGSCTSHHPYILHIHLLILISHCRRQGFRHTLQVSRWREL
jgi:hypothetical protein